MQIVLVLVDMPSGRVGGISILIGGQLNFHGRLTNTEHRFTPPSLMFAATSNDDEVTARSTGLNI